jgi:hypothetical protein
LNIGQILGREPRQFRNDLNFAHLAKLETHPTQPRIAPSTQGAIHALSE